MSGQNSISNLSDNPLNSIVLWSAMTPGTSSAVVQRQVQFRIQAPSGGYRVDAVASFIPGAGETVNGGSTIAAADIGVGLTSITPEHNALLPRADIILPGFDYDPGGVTAANGLTPYNGAAAGRATLADLITSKKILSGNRIGSGNRSLAVTLTFGVLPQYFTPSLFFGTVTLTISTGP